eukprot:tig00000058_g738.t1
MGHPPNTQIGALANAPHAHARQALILALILVFVVVFLLGLYVYLFAPMLARLGEETGRAGQILKMIPRDVVLKCTHLHHYFVGAPQFDFDAAARRGAARRGASGSTAALTRSGCTCAGIGQEDDE